ncbi:ABC transporter substrate-binding protein [Sporosarcina cyprini]|uniref:ABC transporter substrate-binding protein n=1 Tax=Sporosarcina cyprini TaxID=2910523 RepID=UPI001EE0DAF3|nr:ABC transporter substrate-binding protein [Sporosarcina cyprini]MCG3087469.1 SgrR family transcriptional regulator [Sporosarcina cyprini]
MRYTEHLLTLADHFERGSQVETSIALLAGMLNCSERHVKTIMNALHDEQVVSWATKRGRGKKPKLTLLLSKDDILISEARRLAETDRYKDAFALVETSSRSAKENFYEWFTNTLGLSPGREQDEELDTLRYPFYDTQLIMDPMLIKSRHDAHMVQQIFDRLVEYHAETGKLLPRIAHHWETVDGKKWTFYLHKGIHFHHGRKLTSKDVQLTLCRLQKEIGVFQEIKSMAICSETVIQFELSRVDYLFPRSLASMKASIIPIEKGEDDSFRSFPVGSGPYQVLCNNENMIQLGVNASYFSTRPWLDRIEIIKAPAEYEKRQHHPFLLNQPNPSWRQVKQIEEGAMFISCNCVKDGPLRRIEIRKQILERLIPEDMRNEGHDNEFRATSFVSKRSLEKQNAERVRVPEEHFENLTLKIAVQQIRPGANHEKAAKQLQAQLRDMGISSQLELVDSTTLCNEDSLSTYDMFVGGIALGNDEMVSLLHVMQSPSFPIYPCVSDHLRKRMDDVIGMIRCSQDNQTQWDFYFEIEDLLSSEYAILFLNHRQHTVYEPEDSEYVNIKLNCNGRVDYRNVWKK